MEKNNNPGSFVKYAIVLLFVAIIGFVLYGRLKSPNPSQTHPTQSEPVPHRETESVLGDSIVNFGIKYLDTPYVAAGCGKDGFDCSGFVYFVYQHFNIDVPRSSADFEHVGTEIPIENVRKGDLLLFLSPTRNVIGHIGIVTKPNGKQSDFIHASSGREMKVIITSLANEGYTRRFVKAIRIL